uniref:Uncharacterized protein n=1 Tax=Bionectria ochroleuca TaxID=29856 RepID=A0A0B7JZG8_BIOOC
MRHIVDPENFNPSYPCIPCPHFGKNKFDSLNEKEKELQEMIDLADSLTSVGQDLITRSASSFRKKRGNPDKMDEYRKRINEQVAQKRHETNLLWQKRHDLQAEEQKLKEQIRVGIARNYENWVPGLSGPFVFRNFASNTAFIDKMCC